MFNFLKDRLWNKLNGWSVKCLSKAGKAVLLRNVAQAVPSYAMSCFLLPKSLCKELERMMNSFWWGSKEGNRKGIKWLSWTNMSMSKGEGGLGFRDLFGFNLALLGKLRWNLINNPNSLVAKIFKARYYAESSLFEARRGGGASYVWSGIWQAKEVLKKGFKWVLGNGENIRIYEDPWVRGKENYLVDNTYIDVSSGRRVCDLFVPGEKKWDTTKVNNLFTRCDADAILALPIPSNQVQDRIAWMSTLDGKYSVKSGYKFWYDNYSESVRVQSNPGWSKIWQLEVPHKLRVFLWRICRNNVPVRNLLRGKGVQTSIICPMCINDIEHVVHILLDCSFAKECWRVLGLEFDTSTVEYGSEWLLQRMVEEGRETLVRIATGLWAIWSARNLKVWENKCLTPEIAVQMSSKQVAQWKEVQNLNKIRGNGRAQSYQMEVVKWKAPDEGSLKVNVDASVFAGKESFSVGMVLRDHRGGFCRARNMCSNGAVSVFEAETRGVLAAVRWIMELGIVNVVVECDSMLTVQALQKESPNYLEVGNILQDCRILLKDRPDIRISFVKKQANKVAHLLARVPCEASCFNDFISPPCSVLESIVYDASSI